MDMQLSEKTKFIALLRDESGQGTTEYAILVGVLVVIAILAIVSFRGKVQELWEAISSGIGSL
ncbi:MULTISPECIES: Flp family type IVb pilin [Atopobiaceae]|uniref:Flp pilus assembly protein, pilin Flp n=1 Tax=Parafannyhessea umbonata TaxID=604330 RepID=A0A1H9N6L4_9ACTN|nr:MULTISPECIES: hypothetical protein [Atopobiaceae]SEH38155.1 Flp pilus assembly protein, pilin Flp [Parafannyhessea umbonata]SER31407.1 Flp pilus assembly protein, pilin Flp [Parafannyhessea umbonata]SJZ40950.1 Flp pilus assembly protein, pilin Flp [Olsenella sp. KH1P3]